MNSNIIPSQPSHICLVTVKDPVTSFDYYGVVTTVGLDIGAWNHEILPVLP